MMRPIAFVGLSIPAALLTLAAGSGPVPLARATDGSTLLGADDHRSVVLIVTGDTHLRDGAPNQSQSGESLLRLRSSGRNRALVRFAAGDLAEALAGNTLVSAHLELKVRANGGNWGTGRTVDAHRLTASWSESAATWSCPADSDLGNHQPDCAQSWEGGSFEPAAAASVLHTNDLSGWVRFDVTADLEAVLAGAPFHGWLLKKTNEAAAGLVDYSSREVCGEEPRLVLEVEAPGADVEPPRIAFTSPADRFLVNQPVPAFRVDFSDAGSPVDLSSLAVTLDGADLTSTCAVCQASATCPSPALAEGSHTLAARLADESGNVAATTFGFDLLLGDGEHRLTLPAVADTYLRDGAPNQNQGGDTLLRIRSSGKNRALVRFDLDGVEELVENLHSATLQIYLETNGNNWGTSGRTIDAHALGAGWSEAGVTWSCPADSNPSDSRPDCAAPWNGGAFDSTPTDTALVTNGLEGRVSLDVTADVLGALAGEPHHGWLIKKTIEGQNGLAEFSSREGAAGQVPRLVLVFDGGKPQDVQPPSISFLAPADGSLLDDPQPVLSLGFADDASGVDTATLAIERGGSPLAVSCSFAVSTATCVPSGPLPGGAQTLTARIADRAGNVSAPAAVHFTIDTGTPGLPPDPAAVAPPLDRTVATDLFAATEFLYTGDDPIQTGVAPGTIDPRRVAVVRGRVLDRAGDPLPGVRISIHRHPELGATKSRADGAFDLAVNGGGALTVDYSKQGFLPVQRQIEAPWRDYAWADDVVLVQLDPAATTIVSGLPAIQVARGSSVTDEDGTRRATLLFPPSTFADMAFADGTSQPLASLTVRATEYTVGGAGPLAMPAELPANTGYTYAVELSADEAIDAGAQQVFFSRPVALYLENFLDFPTGGIVPAGYYDRELAAWVPSDNGRIVEILSVEGGLAALDVDGSGQPAAPETLAELGVAPEELASLAGLYPAGQSLWRVPVTHFTPWDCNWPYGPPMDAEPPPEPYDSGEDGDEAHDDPEDDSGDEDENDCEEGSIIECQSQVLREEIPLDGSALRLHYGSDRVPGRGAARFRKFRISGESVPSSLKRIDVEVGITGRLVFSASYPPAPNLKASFTWDGRDAYGRLIQGTGPVTVRTTYVYDAVYYEPGNFERSFSRLPSGDALVLNESRGALTYSRTFVFGSSARDLSRNAGHLDWRELGLGGWSLSIHHLYDPVRRTLHTGYGGRRSADPLGQFLVNVAGTGSPGIAGDGGPARQAELSNPIGIARAADGSIYIADMGNHRIRRVSPDGVLATVAGTGEQCEEDGGGGALQVAATAHCGDGGPALLARLNNPRGVAVAPDGRLYIADTGNGCVRRIERDGTISTVAGVCRGVQGGGGHLTSSPVSPAERARRRPARSHSVSGCTAGLLCRATETRLEEPSGLAFTRDGGLYLSDGMAGVVMFVGLDGWLGVAAGGGNPADFIGDGLPATQAALSFPAGLALAPDGTLLIADYWNNRIRRVGLDGIIRTVAGSDPGGFGGDGGPAGEALLSGPTTVAASADGSLFIAEEGNARIRHVSPGGTISTFAGTGEPGFETLPPDGTAALSLRLGSPYGLVLSPNGSLIFVDPSNNYVGSLATDLSGFTNKDIFLPSEDGEVYVFDPKGRHLRTLDALTGAEIHAFRYTASGLLAEVEDADGNLTRIERDASGRPTAVVAPFGQRTELETGPDGYLAGTADPAGLRVYSFVYDEGLLTRRTDPRGNPYEYTYDLLGRLIGSSDPAGGSKTLTRLSGGNRDYTVTVGTALDRTTSYRVSTGRSSQTRLRTDLLGPAEKMETTETISSDGTRTTVLPGGTAVTTREGPDAAWGAASRRGELSEVRAPSGLTSTTLVHRGAELADLQNPFSIVNRFQTVTRNGETFTASYHGPTRTFSLQTPEGRSIVSRTDGRGRFVSGETGGFAPLFLDYDSRGRVSQIRQGTGTEERRITYTYRPDGRLGSVTDPLDRTVSMTYDPLGRLATLAYPDGREVRLVHDATGNLIALSPPGRPAHSFRFTTVDLESEYAPPPIGPEATRTEMTYDADRKVTGILQPGGRSIGVTYDVGGRPIGATTHRGTTSITYRPGTRDPLTVTTPEGNRITYAYDGHLLTSTTWSGKVGGSVQRAYDNDFRLREEKVNGGNAVTFSYDRDGLLIAAGPLAVARGAASGLITSTSLGSVSTAAAYNAFGEPVEVSAAFEGSPLWQVNYIRDKLGRIVQKAETLGGVTDTLVYHYDLAGRLARVEKNGSPFAEYTYDANGNRLSYSGTLGTAAATYDDQDRLLTYGNTTYTYTANGELESKAQNSQTVAYDYDELGNLLEVRLPDGLHIEYVVDGRNRRIGKKVNGALVQGFLYRDQLEPIAELDGSGQVVTRFVYGTRPHVPDSMIKGGLTYRILSDHLGSPRLVIDAATGEIAQRMDYDEFGNVILDTNPRFQPFGFAGGLYDEHTGLVRFGARDYDPIVNRFVTKDPILFAGGDTNLYAYVLNDPINLIDPAGTDWMETAASFSAGFGDVLLLGFGDELRDWTDATFGWSGGALVDECSGAYSAGEWAGVAASTLAGGAAGWKAAGTKGIGKEFSHWIPDALLKRTGSPFIRNTFGGSRFNGNFVSIAEHALNDPARYRFMSNAWKGLNPINAAWQRILNRTPKPWIGGGAGAAYGGAGAGLSGGSCECPQ